MAVKKYTCELVLDINGKKITGKFVTTKKELRNESEMMLKSLLVMAERI